jgi:hypothetical protein
MPVQLLTHQTDFEPYRRSQSLLRWDGDHRAGGYSRASALCCGMRHGFNEIPVAADKLVAALQGRGDLAVPPPLLPSLISQ